MTGLLWAYAPHFYWAPGYKDRKSEFPAPAIEEAKLAIKDVLTRIRKLNGDADEIRSISLRQDFGHLIYDVQRSQGPTILIDAVSGEILSPLGESLAIQAGRQYVPSNFSVQDLQLLDNYVARDGKKFGPSAVVRFKEKGGTEIYIDRSTGSLIEDQDRARRFHFWIMRLHQLRFFGFKKELTILPGLSILLMLSSGFLIFRKIRSDKRLKEVQV
jgi:hypothetical protein